MALLPQGPSMAPLFRGNTLHQLPPGGHTIAPVPCVQLWPYSPLPWGSGQIPPLGTTPLYPTYCCIVVEADVGAFPVAWPVHQLTLVGVPRGSLAGQGNHQGQGGGGTRSTPWPPPAPLAMNQLPPPPSDPAVSSSPVQPHNPNLFPHPSATASWGDAAEPPKDTSYLCLQQFYGLTLAAEGLVSHHKEQVGVGQPLCMEEPGGPMVEGTSVTLCPDPSLAPSASHAGRWLQGV